MLTTIKGVRIRGVCAVVPENTSRFEDEIPHYPFPEKSSRKLARIMGFREHRIAEPGVTHCDLANYVLRHLFTTGLLDKESIAALLFVSQVMEYPVPGNSKVLHGMAELPETAYCADLYENCVGFISGLYAASAMVAAGGVSEVVLVTAESGMSRANILDRNIYPIGGDAAAAVIVSKADSPEESMHFAFHNDGSKRNALMIPAGGQRMPHSEETARMAPDEVGNVRSLNDLHMDGTAVFQYVMENVPPLIGEICQFASIPADSIEYHVTHQPNRFMLEKLADLLGVPRERLFNNIVENFGNSATCTIPVNLAFNLGERLRDSRHMLCLSAFGAGLSRAAALGRFGPLDFCSFLEYPSAQAVAR